MCQKLLNAIKLAFKIRNYIYYLRTQNTEVKNLSLLYNLINKGNSNFSQGSRIIEHSIERHLDY